MCPSFAHLSLKIRYGLTGLVHYKRGDLNFHLDATDTLIALAHLTGPPIVSHVLLIISLFFPIHQDVVDLVLPNLL